MKRGRKREHRKKKADRQTDTTILESNREERVGKQKFNFSKLKNSAEKKLPENGEIFIFSEKIAIFNFFFQNGIFFPENNFFLEFFIGKNRDFLKRFFLIGNFYIFNPNPSFF